MSIGNGSVLSVSVSVGIATGIYGISFGALSVTAGFDLWQTIALSCLMFSGGSQFAFIGVFATGGFAALPAAIASAWLVGIRNGFYALALAPVVGSKGWGKLVAAQLTIDESAAVSGSRVDAHEKVQGFWFTGIAVFVFWNLATLLGGLLGGVLSDPEVFGLDAAASAALFALVWPRIQESTGALIAGCAIISSVAFSLILPTGFPVLIGAFVSVVLGFWLDRKTS